MSGERAGVDPGLLPDDVHRRLLTWKILPRWTREAVPQQHPVSVLVAGPPGAGKTTLAEMIHTVLQQPRGGAVRIGRDPLKAEHGHYARLLEANVRTADVRHGRTLSHGRRPSKSR